MDKAVPEKGNVTATMHEVYRGGGLMLPTLFITPAWAIGCC